MDEKATYISINESVMYSFDECINEEYFNVYQTSAKILEEDWREVNKSIFTKRAYILNIALESFKLGEIADFINDKLDEIIEYTDSYDAGEEELLLFNYDLKVCSKIKKLGNYNIIETPLSAKSRIEYLLNIANQK